MDNLLSFILGVSAPIITQLVAHYVSNRESNRNKKLENIRLAITTVIELTELINQCYEYIKSPIHTDNDGRHMREHNCYPTFKPKNELDLKFINSDLSFRISILPTRLKYIKDNISLYYDNVSLDDDKIFVYSNDLYKEFTVELIDIREKICKEYKLPKDKLFDLSDLYGAL
ncbi:hypothetical protein ACBQ20_10330 [Proteus vulgaris]|uniref:hypothetical protein n=1 Tax=Proteus vulgaris TaxID=585 RepID=UPI0035266CDE